MIITWLLIVLAVCCIIGILTEKIAIGIVFVMSLFISLYGVFIPLRKQRLTGIGAIIVIVGIMSLAYTVCELFFNMDVKTILGF